MQQSPEVSEAHASPINVRPARHSVRPMTRATRACEMHHLRLLATQCARSWQRSLRRSTQPVPLADAKPRAAFSLRKRTSPGVSEAHASSTNVRPARHPVSSMTYPTPVECTAPAHQSHTRHLLVLPCLAYQQAEQSMAAVSTDPYCCPCHILRAVPAAPANAQWALTKSERATSQAPRRDA